MINKLNWDSSFFDYPIYDLDGKEIHHKNVAAELSRLNECVVQCKLNILLSKSIETLVRLGFSIENTGIIYKKKIEKKNEKKIALASIKDEKDILNIVKKSFINTRFKDNYFGKESSTKIYSSWASAAIIGNYDDCCLVKRKGNMVIGFVTIRKIEDYIRIGLIAVDNNYQKEGVGRELMQSVEAYAIKHDIKDIEVTTQYNNSSARKLYQSLGYYEDLVFMWLYIKLNSHK